MHNHIKMRRPSFTLIEMTIVIAIIGILAAMAMSVYATALSQSKAHRTRAMIAKIDQLIGEKYESYRTRQVPIRIPPGMNPYPAARFRLDALRELMRLEMPDRQSDIMDVPSYANAWVPAYVALPSLTKNYRRRANQQAHQVGNPSVTGIIYWTDANENAECLYLILAAMRDGDKNALDYFSPTEIGDVDGDGMNEILDGWGQPIVFLRWAPAYRADIAPFPVTPQTMADPDPFDPMKVDPRWAPGSPFNPFALKPLVWSAGPDRRHDINVATPTDASNNAIPYGFSGNSPRNDPYFSPSGGIPVVGAPADSNNDGSPDYTDNITNHDLEAR